MGASLRTMICCSISTRMRSEWAACMPASASLTTSSGRLISFFMVPPSFFSYRFACGCPALGIRPLQHRHLLLQFGTISITHSLLLLGRPAEFTGHKRCDFINDARTSIPVLKEDASTSCQHVIECHGHLLSACIDHLSSKVRKIFDKSLS